MELRWRALPAGSAIKVNDVVTSMTSQFSDFESQIRCELETSQTGYTLIVIHRILFMRARW